MSVEVGICVDVSGSMQDIWATTCKGFAEYMGDLRRSSDAKVTLVTFQGANSRVVLRSVEPSEVKSLDDYGYPEGKTPMYDAICDLISTMRINADKDVGKLVIVHTDGGENYSRRYSEYQTRAMVEEAMADEWGFLFVGVGINEEAADRMASSIGMPSGSVLAVSRQATRAAFRKVSAETSRASVRTP